MWTSLWSAPYTNARFAYVVAVFAAIELGLGSRAFTDHLPIFVAEHFGDVLWASMIYFGFRACFTHKKIFFALWCSIAFCFAIEFSQLYQAVWINQIRGTTLGALVLGKGFLVEDLVRYSAGIAVSSLFDLACLWRKRSS
ncbi:DUF2809 domain-containing protein [Brevibacillus porteri]|uniref:ribosomal maturation YjgA family protein n=1 Tax=Brevibacillus porteri TaxID=2126350 RepID=UPI001FC9B40B|nr:DUF2809 domain-containing protein [Brevibacillus porteri]MED1799176.1 DUF2809 domain-containing protein [Brevibacillus porteri]MED2132436.1 DUF2809 domain-containing protein [Brevibacillus porteri]MED2744519.1 DUF2809 domain-containing protein [Brevibacillus porteri]MED2814963.1 DUF2809 domain-containing protein [Brevibacillus porteri]MED2895591.1 DUF2809 domain-containing protein [Brevibacillus porteri]